MINQHSVEKVHLAITIIAFTVVWLWRRSLWPALGQKGFGTQLGPGP